MTPKEQATLDAAQLQRSSKTIERNWSSEDGAEYTKHMTEAGFEVLTLDRVGLVNHRRMKTKARRKRSRMGRY